MRKTFIFTALLQLGLVGCGPGQGAAPPSSQAQRYADAICSAREVCDCEDGRFASMSACEEQIVAAFTDAEIELEIDQGCLDALLTSGTMTACSNWSAGTVDWQCPVLVGSQQAGQACSNHWDMLPLVVAECDEGLSCIGAVCRAAAPVPHTVEVGDPCVAQDLVPCPGVGLYCSVSAGNVCAIKAGMGSACVESYGCEPLLYCEGLGAAGTGSCASVKELGETCDPKDWWACSPDAWCDATSSTCIAAAHGVCYLTHPLAFG